MAERPPNLPGDADLRIAEITSQFETEWQQAVAGQLRPCVETHLDRIEETQRENLRRALEAVAERYVDGSHAGRPRDDRSPGHEAPLTQTLASPEAGRDSSRPLRPAVQEAGCEATSTRGPQLAQRASADAKITAASSTTQSVPGTTIEVPGYEILGELGRGGMGVVYRARQTALNRVVALKMIVSGGHADSAQRARFAAEAEAVAQLQHPNIVQIFDIGEQNGLPFFSLEFVDGRALNDELDGRPMPTSKAIELMETVARAIEFSHQHGIVHRDLKPANILLTRAGLPKVTDFGLVKRLEEDSGQTASGAILGTPSYMAPEQARGDKEVGPAADIYALGAMLYCLLTGRVPFLGATAINTIKQVLEQEVVAPSRLQPQIPKDLETICLTCLNKESSQRYSSAAALAEDLKRLREGRPILARPVSRPERLWRWCRRNPWIAIPSATAAALALTLMIGGPLAAVSIYKQKLVADENARRAEKHASATSKHSEIAVETLRILVYNISLEKFKDVNHPEFRELRQALITDATNGLIKVADNQPDFTGGDVLLASTSRKMAESFLFLGRHDEAREQAERCLTIAQQLEKEGRLTDKA